MRLTEIYTTNLKETLDNSLPYKKISDTRYLIQLDEQNRILVVLHQENVQKYKCLAVLFQNPDSSNPLATTNFFKGPGAIRVFSTIVAILDLINFDLVFFTPDDISIEVENKKASLYKVILKKLERSGKLLATEIIHLPEFDKPIFVGMKVPDLTIEQLKDIIKQYGLSKIM